MWCRGRGSGLHPALRTICAHCITHSLIQHPSWAPVHWKGVVDTRSRLGGGRLGAISAPKAPQILCGSGHRDHDLGRKRWESQGRWKTRHQSVLLCFSLPIYTYLHRHPIGMHTYIHTLTHLHSLRHTPTYLLYVAAYVQHVHFLITPSGQRYTCAPARTHIHTSHIQTHPHAHTLIYTLTNTWSILQNFPSLSKKNCRDPGLFVLTFPISQC